MPLRSRRDEVIADLHLVLEELPGHHRADRVAADVLRTGAAATVAVEARHRVGAARFEPTTQHVELAVHEDQRMSDVLVLTEDEVRRLLDPAELFDALGLAFRAISDGTASVPPRVAAHAPGGLLGTMPGYLPGLGLGAKVVTYFRGNHERGLPGHQALVALFDPDDGRPLALMDGTHITALRTATAAAVAARALARSDAAVVAVLGTGVQGRSHLDAFGRAFPGAAFRVAGRNRDHAEALASQWQSAEHPRVEVAADFASAVRDADVVCLCTDADEPVISRGWLPVGCHVSSVGSGVEVDAETVTAARVFVESRAVATQPFPAGSRELAGQDPETVTEVGEVLLGSRPGRTSDDELTLYKSMGHATQDVAAAAVVLRAARATGTGKTVSF